MIIKSMTIENFRQFKEKQKIEFSTSQDQNVTIIHGENGSGKTTLLQAFLWCFYGEDNINLTHKDMILNKSIELSMDSNDVRTIEVSIEFIHENTNYFIKRTQDIRKELNGKMRKGGEIFEVKYLDRYGNNSDYTKESPENFINRIFPEKLSSYFFFDGERIKDLGNNSRNGRKDLSQAVSNILGLDILETAKSHIVKVKKLFEREQISNFEPDKINKINNEIDEIKQKIDIYNKKEEGLNSEIEDIDSQIEEYANKLKNIQQSKELQEKREYIESQIEKQNERIEHCREDIFKNFSNNAYIFFAQQLFLRGQKILSNHKVEDKHIEGISGKAIDFILDRGKCFCGKEITEDCPEYKMWMELKKYLPPQSFGVMIGNFNKEIKIKSSSIDNFKEEVKKYNNRFLKEKLYLDDLSDKLSDTTKSIEGINFEAIKRTEEEYSIRKGRKKQITEQELPTVKSKILSYNEILKAKQKEREESIVYNQKNLLLNKRIKVCNELEEKFKLYLNEREKSIRQELKERVESIFNSIIHKDYSINIDEKYRFDVIDENDMTVPMSEGERQVTSLSFISGLIDIARNEELNERLAKNTGYNSREMYPLVMDSPFGSLDSEHRKNISISIPKLSEQVVIFASSTQWKGEVERELRQVVGKEYILNYNKKYMDNVSIEYTEIEEVGV